MHSLLEHCQSKQKGMILVADCMLVVAPHPDDEIIGCGAVILDFLKKDHDVHVAYVTSGDAANPDIPRDEYCKIREEEIKEAGKMLGIPSENQHLLYAPVHNIDEWGLFKKMQELVREIQPDFVFIPPEHDEDIDHVVVAKVGKDATYRAPSKWFRKVGDYRGGFPRASIFAYEVGTPLVPCHFVHKFDRDILQRKMDALACYKTQRVSDYMHRNGGLHAFRGGAPETWGEAFAVIHLSKSPF